MRYLDLAVAALIGTSAITGVISWDPRAGDAGSHRLELQTRLRDGLLALIQEQGVAWFVRTPPATVCAYLAARSNSSYGLHATLGADSCGSPPRPGSAVASLTMDLLPFEVTLVAWSLA